MRRTVLIGLVALLILTSCAGLSGGCSKRQLDEYAEATDEVLRRFDDTVAVADSTARIELSGPMTELRAIRRDAEDLEIPDCAQEAHEWLLGYMNATIDAYTAFQGDEYRVDVSANFYIADESLEHYERALELAANPAADITIDPIPTPTADPCHPDVLQDVWAQLAATSVLFYGAFDDELPDEMQAYRDEMAAIEVPYCAEAAKAAMLISFDADLALFRAIVRELEIAGIARLKEMQLERLRPLADESELARGNAEYLMDELEELAEFE